MAGDLESTVRAWTAAYTEEVAEFAPPDQVSAAFGQEMTENARAPNQNAMPFKSNSKPLLSLFSCPHGSYSTITMYCDILALKVNDSQVFGEVFHSLIHSPLSMTLLQVLVYTNLF